MKIEKQIEEHDQLLLKASNSGDAQQINTLGVERRDLEKQKEILYESWQNLIADDS